MKKLMMLVVVMLLAVANVAWADTFDAGGANEFTIDFVDISGDASSANGTYIGHNKLEGFIDPINDYRMGTHEITNDQWNKFKASYGTVTGDPSSAYDSSPYYTGDDIPTNRLSWFEGAQFVNYLNSSTGHREAYKFTGTQGTADYTFSVWEPEDSGYDSDNPFRNSEAFYFMPTENEWVKAAYWNGTSLQAYATIDGSVPVAGVDSNYGNSTSQPWDVGSGSPELNGTFDMMGNVWEWMESPWYIGEYNSLLYHRTLRGIRGGSFIYPDDNLASSFRYSFGPYLQGSSFGFRVASVPEPATLLLFGLGGLALHKRRK